MSARLIFSKVVTATENGVLKDLGAAIQAADGLRATLILSAIGGTSPTFDVTIEDSPGDAVPTVFTRGTFAQLTANGSESIAIAGAVHSKMRARVVAGGTSPTAQVDVWVE